MTKIEEFSLRRVNNNKLHMVSPVHAGPYIRKDCEELYSNDETNMSPGLGIRYEIISIAGGLYWKLLHFFKVQRRWKIYIYCRNENGRLYIYIYIHIYIAPSIFLVCFKTFTLTNGGGNNGNNFFSNIIENIHNSK